MSDEQRRWNGSSAHHCWHCPMRAWEGCTISCLNEWKRQQEERAKDGVIVTGGDWPAPADWG